MKKYLIFISFILSAMVIAQVNKIEVIQLKHRTAQELIELIRPHLKSENSLSGQNTTLVIRGTPSDIEEIQLLVSQLDTPLKQFKISLKKGSDSVERTDINNIYYTSKSMDERQVQTIYVLEGKKGKLNLGEAKVILFPIYQFHTHTLTQLQSIETQNYFEVTPKIIGSKVVLDIAQQIEYWDNVHEYNRHHTTLSASVEIEMGTWTPLGDVDISSYKSQNQILTTASQRTRNEQWSIRVDLAND